MDNIGLSESKQLIEYLYKYLEELKLELPIYLEYLPGAIKALAMKQIPGSCKTRSNVIGGYEAELPFAIYSDAKIKDTRSIFDITKPLNDLGEIFKEETKNNFPTLKIGEYIPLKIEMVSTPSDASGKEDGSATFMALYKLTYKKKSKYE